MSTKVGFFMIEMQHTLAQQRDRKWTQEDARYTCNSAGASNSLMWYSCRLLEYVHHLALIACASNDACQERAVSSSHISMHGIEH